MRIPVPLLLLAALAAMLLAPTTALATEGEHEHDPTATCVWQADAAPVFPPGEQAVLSIGLVPRYSVLGERVGIESWSVVVLPGYHVGFVYAQDHGAPYKSSVVQSFARRSVYGIYRSVDCCAPARRVKAFMACGFGVRAQVLNSPGSASAQGVTHILAVNTQLSLTTAAAVTTKAADGGTDVVIEMPGPGGSKVAVKFAVGFDSEDESVDQISLFNASPSLPAPDEEYHISTDIDLKAVADGNPLNEGEAQAFLYGHRVTLTTRVDCGHCGKVANDHILIDGAMYGTE